MDAVMLQEKIFEAGWSDGLPVVPPTRARVQEFIEYAHDDASRSLGEVPPLGGDATIDKLAANAVLAGCKPEYFPVILAAVEAMLDPSFGLHGVQCSTGIATPLVIVHGPIVQKIDMNCGTAVFGNGNRANATIGRAVKLIQLLIGGAYPGMAEKKPFAHPGKFSFCIAENEDVNAPWEPYHVEHGFNREDSVVTVYAAEAPAGVMGGGSPEEVLDRCADRVSSTGTVNMSIMRFGDVFVLLGQDHKELMDRSGWNKQDVRTYLWEHARRPLSQVRPGLMDSLPSWVDQKDPDALAPVVRREDNIKILVTGGPGVGQSVVLNGWGTRAISRKIIVPN